MKHTDEQIITTIREILEKLHDPHTGFNGFRNELKEQHLKKDEHDKRILQKEIEIASQYGLEKADFDEQKFRISGKDVMENHLYVSCGQAAKAFCYVNSQLPKGKQLDLMILLSTDIENLVDGKAGHTLPCVKLSDGKYHAIEPQIAPTKEKPGFQFVSDDVKVGGEIWHLSKEIKEKGRPYKITKIVTPEYQANELSDFGRFLDESTIRKGKLGFLCSSIKLILQHQKLEQYKNQNRQIYEFCKALQKNNHQVKILVFTDEKNISCRPCIEQDNTYYGINLNKSYLSLWKYSSVEEIEKSFKTPFKLQQVLTPQEYINEFEKRTNLSINIQNNERG